MRLNNQRMFEGNSLKSSKVMMEFFDYKCRSSFWDFVHREAVPYKYVNARKKMFSPVEVNNWLDKRSTTVDPAYCTFNLNENQDLPSSSESGTR